MKIKKRNQVKDVREVEIIERQKSVFSSLPHVPGGRGHTGSQLSVAEELIGVFVVYHFCAVPLI